MHDPWPKRSQDRPTISCRAGASCSFTREGPQSSLLHLGFQELLKERVFWIFLFKTHFYHVWQCPSQDCYNTGAHIYWMLQKPSQKTTCIGILIIRQIFFKEKEPKKHIHINIDIHNVCIYIYIYTHMKRERLIDSFKERKSEISQNAHQRNSSANWRHII